jgi:hypothetical protein
MAVWKRRSVWLTVGLFSGLVVGLPCLFLLGAGNATLTAYERITPGMHRDQVWATFGRQPDDCAPVVAILPGAVSATGDIIPVNRQLEMWGSFEDGAHVLYDDEGTVVSKEWRTGPGWFRRTAARLGIPLP